MTPTNTLRPYYVQNNEQSFKTLEKLLFKAGFDDYHVCRPNKRGQILVLIIKNRHRIMAIVYKEDIEYQVLDLIEKVKESALTLHDNKCNVITKENKTQ